MCVCVRLCASECESQLICYYNKLQNTPHNESITRTQWLFFTFSSFRLYPSLCFVLNLFFFLPPTLPLFKSVPPIQIQQKFTRVLATQHLLAEPYFHLVQTGCEWCGCAGLNMVEVRWTLCVCVCVCVCARRPRAELDQSVLTPAPLRFALPVELSKVHT